MQISVQIQLQQIARIVTRTARLRRLGPLEPQLRHRQPVHERIDHPAYMIGWNQIVQNHRKQRPLTPAFSSDVAQKE